MPDSATPWTVACTKLLRPRDFLGKSNGVGCHFLLQGIFPTQGSNPGLLHCRRTLYCLSHQEVKGSPQKHLTHTSREKDKSITGLPHTIICNQQQVMGFAHSAARRAHSQVAPRGLTACPLVHTPHHTHTITDRPNTHTHTRLRALFSSCQPSFNDSVPLRCKNHLQKSTLKTKLEKWSNSQLFQKTFVFLFLTNRFKKQAWMI